MACLVCRLPGDGCLCPSCHSTLAPAAECWIDGLLVRSVFRHEGAARRIVHLLKYSGVVPPGIGRVLADRLPAGAQALMPVPRVMLRRWRYGVDPALELAWAASRVSGIPVSMALSPPAWVRRRAGGAGARRGQARFRLQGPVPPGVVLVDDVVTTGNTLLAAAAATGASVAVTLTSAVRPSSDEAGRG